MTKILAFLSFIIILIVSVATSHPLVKNFVYMKRREINKEGGFHRMMRTEFIVPVDSDLNASRVWNASYVEELSSDVYIDIYEMKNVKPDILLLKDQEYINVETPSYYSMEYNITLSKIISQMEYHDAHNIVVTFEFPLHLRYQKPSSESSFGVVKIKNPHIFYMNHIEYTIIVDDNSDTSSLNQVMIPVGNLNDFHLVRFVTLSITILSCLFVCMLSFQKNDKY
nr:unnamed protein product [Naegleria fowleri]